LSATRTAVIATVNALPSSPSGTNGSRCSTGTVNLSATAGAGETISLIANNIFANLGTFTFQVGNAANPGGTAASNVGNVVAWLVGAGGGGGTGAAGGINAAGVYPGLPTTPINTNGVNGPMLYKPTLMLYSGQGGGGSTAGNGGNGGNGAPGCGGGGGGASTNTGVNAGNGGNGGNGFIIITTSI
jgi:hypothetical protein